MPRRARQAPGGLVYHVLNRAVGRMKLFTKDADYQAFERVLAQAHQRIPTMRILSYCLMPNHWHFVLWPRADGELSRFMFWLTMTHTQRWRHARKLVGLGPLYQGRFKAFPIEQDDHLSTVIRYVERNPLRANLVKRAQDWPHGSLAARLRDRDPRQEILSPWPIDIPTDYLQWVNQPQTQTEIDALQTAIRRNRPFGDATWQKRTITRLGLESSIRPKGGQRKTPSNSPKEK
jgi:putative transposase